MHNDKVNAPSNTNYIPEISITDIPNMMRLIIDALQFNVSVSY